MCCCLDCHQDQSISESRSRSIKKKGDRSGIFSVLCLDCHHHFVKGKAPVKRARQAAVIWGSRASDYFTFRVFVSRLLSAFIRSKEETSGHNGQGIHICLCISNSIFFSDEQNILPSRVLVQIQLMIGLCIPPLSCLQNLRRDLTLLPPLRLYLLRHLLGRLLLFWRVVEDTAAVLSSRVHALAVFGRGIVHFVEEFEEGGV